MVDLLSDARWWMRTNQELPDRLKEVHDKTHSCGDQRNEKPSDNTMDEPQSDEPPDEQTS